MSRIVMIIAHSMFRDEELFHTKAQLEKDGHEVTVASSRKGICEGSRGGQATAEITLEEINIAQTDALVFVGGPGTPEYFENDLAHKLAGDFLTGGKILAAICISPVVLAKAGLLREKRATVFSSGAQVLEENGAIYTAEEVTADGNIVTGNGPASAVKFAQKISELLADGRKN